MSSLPSLPDQPAGPSRGRRVAGLALSPLAGAAHLMVLDRYARGTILAASFVVGASLLLAGTVVWTGPGRETLRIVGWSLLAVSCLLSIADTARGLLFTDHERRRRRRDAAFRRGLAAAVRGEPEASVRSFREAVRLDPGLPAARFHLAVALARLRRPRAARRQFRRCVRWDPDRAWADEVERELAAAAAPRPRRRRNRNKPASSSL